MMKFFGHTSIMKLIQNIDINRIYILIECILYHHILSQISSLCIDCKKMFELKRICMSIKHD